MAPSWRQRVSRRLGARTAWWTAALAALQLVGCGLTSPAWAQRAFQLELRQGLAERLRANAAFVERSAVIGSRLLEYLETSGRRAELREIYESVDNLADLVVRYGVHTEPFWAIVKQHVRRPADTPDGTGTKGRLGDLASSRLDHRCVREETSKLLREKAGRLRMLANHAARLTNDELSERLEEELKQIVLHVSCWRRQDLGTFVGNHIPLSFKWDSRCTVEDKVERDGTVSPYYPAVVGLLSNREIPAAPFCTGTLIAPNAVLTAAHCVCGAARFGTDGRNSDDYASCVRGSLVRNGQFQPLLDTSDLSVFAQHAGVVATQFAVVHHGYSWQGGLPASDLAILFLKESIAGLPVPAIDTLRIVRSGRVGIVVGFGWSNPIGPDGRPTSLFAIQSRTGIKLAGRVAPQNCYFAEWSRRLICWDYRSQEGDIPLGSSCHGDSGGPILFEQGSTTYLSGVISAGSGCLPGARAYSVDVYPYSSWIAGVLRRIPAPSAKAIPAMTNQVRCRYFDLASSLTKGSVTVPKAAKQMRVSANCTPTGRPMEISAMLGSSPGSPARVCKSGLTSASVASCATPVKGGETWEVKLEFERGLGPACQIVVATDG